MNHMIRLLAFDYDGTAAESGGLPSARVLDALKSAQALGVRTLLATGRSFASASRYALAMGLSDPVICYQGSMVRELAPPHRTPFFESLPDEGLRDLLALAERWGLDMGLYSESAMYLRELRHPAAYYDQWFGLPRRVVRNLYGALEAMRAEGEIPIKCLIICEPGECDRLTPELAQRVAATFSVVRSHDMFVEVTSNRASKGRALAFLAETWGIPQHEVMAVGDSENDASMIAWAGTGVAMGNAPDYIRARADWVAPPVEQDGLAVAIERFVLAAGRA
jgi:hypothetical protein